MNVARQRKRRLSTRLASDGRFTIRPPAEGTWSIVASDSGFAPVTKQISKTTAGPLIFRLQFVDSRDVPDMEAFNHECRCPRYFGVQDR